MRREGLEISSKAKAIFQRYTDGEVNPEELDRALAGCGKNRFDRQVDFV
jgi:hypothetical protein